MFPYRDNDTPFVLFAAVILALIAAALVKAYLL